VIRTVELRTVLSLFCVLTCVGRPDAQAEESPDDILAKLDAQWSEIQALSKTCWETSRRIKAKQAILKELSSALPDKAGPDIAAARAALTEAQARQAAVAEEVGVAAAKTRLEELQRARDLKIDALMGHIPKYRALQGQLAEAKESIDRLSRKIGRSFEDTRALAVARRNAAEASGQLYAVRSVFWERAEVKPTFLQSKAAYEANGKARKNKKYANATAVVRQAERACADAEAAAVE